MKHVFKLIALVVCIGATSVAFAKNKENCHKIGGKWLPGSDTNLEKGACFFAIAVKPSKDVLVADSRAISEAECKDKGGKVSKQSSQCSIDFDGTSGPVASSTPKAATKTMSVMIETGQMLDKGKK